MTKGLTGENTCNTDQYPNSQTASISLENTRPLVVSKEYSRLVTFHLKIDRYSRRSERSSIQDILLYREGLNIPRCICMPL